ncbi:transporter substrate-binding domain-containing protein [Sinorhizobium fredii]|uniref:Amino acid ABC transporter substrate-binding protein n=1 Tax=Rhizobium fredii TaxID=380 RepID=A0A2L0HDY2_RHIFR|nr:transporter substrate-binding domain-containing protein [Sinorhizobium fredii]AUX78959.1 amino acid ABC transporter substrate-binding protein [Sinorhizobium fredii]
MNGLVKRFTATASIALASFSFAISAHAGGVLDRVLATKTLTVATAANFPPASFVNDKGQLDGFDIEVAKEVAKYMGVEAKFVTPGWDIVTSGKWEGRWDLAMHMSQTAARAKLFDLEAVYLYNYMVAVVHKDSKATKPSDLDGKVIGVTAGSAEESYAKHTLEPYNAPPIKYQFAPGEIKSYESNSSARDDLRLGDGVRLDGIIDEERTANEAIRAGYSLKIIGEPLNSAATAIPVLHGDKEFSDKVAAAIKSMREDGTLSKLSIKWWGSDQTSAK